MAVVRSKSPDSAEGNLPLIPLTPAHWQSIVETLELSPQEARVVELTVRGAARKQVAAMMGISLPTVSTYLLRIREKTGAHGLMELALCILRVSHAVEHCACHTKR